MKDERESKGIEHKKEVNRKLIIQALTDPEFRKSLAADPAKTLGIRDVSQKNEDEIRFVLSTVRAIEYQISSLADELLCANGPCGIATTS